MCFLYFEMLDGRTVGRMFLKFFLSKLRVIVPFLFQGVWGIGMCGHEKGGVRKNSVHHPYLKVYVFNEMTCQRP